ncbi:hypothetical protein KKH13_04060 [Patescibacteria group bacterium]|nr:hypothetical protein [Patescibacteria group bacterium]
MENILEKITNEVAIIESSEKKKKGDLASKRQRALRKFGVDNEALLREQNLDLLPFVLTIKAGGEIEAYLLVKKDNKLMAIKPKTEKDKGLVIEENIGLKITNEYHKAEPNTEFQDESGYMNNLMIDLGKGVKAELYLGREGRYSKTSLHSSTVFRAGSKEVGEADLAGFFGMGDFSVKYQDAASRIGEILVLNRSK